MEQYLTIPLAIRTEIVYEVKTKTHSGISNKCFPSIDHLVEDIPTVEILKSDILFESDEEQCALFTGVTVVLKLLLATVVAPRVVEC